MNEKTGGEGMIPTKTFDEIRKAHYARIPKKADINEWKKFDEIMKKERWVSVDVLRQVFKKAEVICYAANGDEIIMYDPKILKEVLVGLEPEEAKKP